MKSSIMDRMQIILFIVFCIGANIQQAGAQLSLQHVEGDLITLPCSLTGSYTYPEWRGPPSFKIYASPGSATINPILPAAGRLSYASNEQDLLLTNAVVADSGEYKCSAAGLGDHTITLTVAVKTTTTTVPPRPGFKWFGSSMKKSISIVILIVIIIVGILVILCVTSSVWGGCMLKGHGRCCSDEGRTFPNWYYKCEKSTWGLIFPVAFGIWVAKKCCGNEANSDHSHELASKEDTNAHNGKSDGHAEGKPSGKPKQGKVDIEKSGTRNVTNQPNNPRPLPKPESGGPLLGGRAESDSAVSRTDIELKESENKLTKRPMPAIPQGHDNKGRGLSANYDDDHPMIGVNLPAGKGNTLDPLKPINEGDQEPKKLKKKKKKKKMSEDTSEIY